MYVFTFVIIGDSFTQFRFAEEKEWITENLCPKQVMVNYYSLQDIEMYLYLIHFLACATSSAQFGNNLNTQPYPGVMEWLKLCAVSQKVLHSNRISA